MPRPQKRRRICSIPGHCRFGPRGEAASCTIVMTLDEYEAIRLIDLLGCTQEECARQMGVAGQRYRLCMTGPGKNWRKYWYRAKNW